MKSTWSMIIAAAAIIFVLVIISSSGKKAPGIPRDALHEGRRTIEDCALCHAQGEQAPLKKDHPPKEQCFLCHKAR